MLLRLCRAYGTRIETLLKGSSKLEHLGENFGGDLYQREVEYLIAQEFATCAEDVLWRRSKLGLHLSTETQTRLAGWFATRD